MSAAEYGVFIKGKKVPKPLLLVAASLCVGLGWSASAWTHRQKHNADRSSPDGMKRGVVQDK
jgi:hypothetical protein